MQDELTRYIVVYYKHLLTSAEWKAWNAIIHVDKVKQWTPEFADGATTRLIAQGVLPTQDDEAVNQLLASGADTFFRKLRDRILTEHKDKVFLNYCPVCGVLARTPQAQQCPKGHRWEKSV